MTSSSSTPEPDLVHLGRLARLAIPPEERAALARDLRKILDYVAELEAVDVSDVPPMVHPLPFDAPLRADVPAPPLAREVALASSPEHDSVAFVVPRVL